MQAVYVEIVSIPVRNPGLLSRLVKFLVAEPADVALSGN